MKFKLFKLGLVVVLCCAISACGMGPFFIKRSVSSLEKDMAKELKAYADFNDTQEDQIHDLANKLANWIRSNRLLALQSELNNLADDIQLQGQLQEQNWQSFVIFLEDPFVLEQGPDLLESMSSIIFEMDSMQSKTAIEKLTKDQNNEAKEHSKTTAEDQLDELMSAIKTVFKDLGIERSKKQLAKARETLSKRRDYINFYSENSIKQVEEFSHLLKTKRESKEKFHTQFLIAWNIATATPRANLPEDWQHNFVISYTAMNGLLEDLDQDQRFKAATKIRKYADLFGELSVIKQ